jgi:hypothetical protein
MLGRTATVSMLGALVAALAMQGGVNAAKLARDLRRLIEVVEMEDDEQFDLGLIAQMLETIGGRSLHTADAEADRVLH